MTEPMLKKARELGRGIAVSNCTLLVGMTEGVPQEAVKGAKETGGLTIGFSPALNMSDHVQDCRLPLDNLDLIAFTGFGFEGRNVILVRTCDAAVIVSGRIGTLNEFTIAYDENRVIGVLEHTGGVSDLVRGILGSFSRVSRRSWSARYFRS